MRAFVERRDSIAIVTLDARSGDRIRAATVTERDPGGLADSSKPATPGGIGGARSALSKPVAAPTPAPLRSRLGRESLVTIWPALAGDSELDAIVVRAEGPDFWPESGTELEDSWFPAAHDCWVPIILAMQGRCTGAGLVLLGQSDVVIAARDAKLVVDSIDPLPYRETTWQQGVLPYGELARLAMLGDGGAIDARRGYELGIFSDVVRPDELFERALAEARLLVGLPRAAVRASKEVIQRGRYLYVRDAARLGQVIAMRNR